ncbi:MAG: carbamoyltransferase [Deltaproteobacteria bacterium]|jgi:carbamoyltransferase|nr:carbamoyltransferase [Deltaproteobacteria bacterium]
MYVLGLSAFYHDSAASLISDGIIVAAAQEERFSRIKHDPRFPIHAIQYCLREAGIDISQVDHVVFYEKPIPKFERLLMSYLTVAPRGLLSWLRAMPSWLSCKLHIPRVIQKKLGYKGDILFTEHHEAHAASSFYPSPYDSAAILTMDGVGEWATASYGIGQDNEIIIKKELHFPDSLGLLYSAFTFFTGFKVNSGEYKLMGLAPYGEPKYKDLILEHLVDLKEDGSLRLNLSYFDFLSGLKMTNGRFAKLFGGPPRIPESDITQREMDIAASIQAVTEEAVLRMARHVRRETGMKKLCIAGGVALNCVANGRLIREGIFDDIWVQPAAGDAGAALGAALSVWHSYLGKKRIVSRGKDSQRGSYLGPSYSNVEIERFLMNADCTYHQMKRRDRNIEVAQMLSDGKIVGYFSGRMEFGPRALGARSILGDPRRKEMQTIMNLKIKNRESFRPFAPSVLEERAGDYFDISCRSPYMLFVANLNEDRRIFDVPPKNTPMMERLKAARSDIPAVTHIDYSARLQTVDVDDNPDYHEIISEFEKLTGCAVIVNTSFNIRGEPIVCYPEDAYRCFMSTEMDILVLEDYILYKGEQNTLDDNEKFKNTFKLD